MTDAPLILYIPGLLPKPAADVHRRELLRCLLASVRRIDADVARDIEDSRSGFDIVSWTFDFYGEYRDIELDLPDIEAALAKLEPSESDIEDAVNWKRRLMHSMYRTGDMLPFLIPRLANERLEIHLRDMRRYALNENDIAEHVRRLLKVPLETAAAGGRPVLLLAHSMGSVIAWDALWQMSYRDNRDVPVDRWLTLGSPLGGNYVQERLLGYRDSGDSGDSGDQRFPTNIGRWENIAAVGELTALDRTLANDFREMIELGLVENIVDHEIFSFYRSEGALNVHNEYGYLMHEVTAGIVCEWWRSIRRGQ